MADLANLQGDADSRIDPGRRLVQWPLADVHLALASALRWVDQVVGVVRWPIVVSTGLLRRGWPTPSAS